MRSIDGRWGTCSRYRGLRGFGAVFALALLFGSSAVAEEDEATALFRRGRSAMKDGDCTAAIPLLTQSQALDPSIGTALNLAICEEQTRHLLAAIEHFTFVASGTSAKDSRKAFAEQRVRALSERLAYITAELPHGHGEDAEILLDGSALDEKSLGKAIGVDPGLHKLTLRTSGDVQVEEKLDLRDGERRTWIPQAAPALGANGRANTTDPSPAANRKKKRLRARPTETKDSGSPTAGYVFLGVGTAALATSLVLGLFVMKKDKIAKAHCERDGSCDETGIDAVNAGKTFETLANISALVAVPAFGLGTYLVLTYDRPDSHSASTNGMGGKITISIPVN